MDYASRNNGVLGWLSVFLGKVYVHFKRRLYANGRKDPHGFYLTGRGLQVLDDTLLAAVRDAESIPEETNLEEFQKHSVLLRQVRVEEGPNQFFLIKYWKRQYRSDPAISIGASLEITDLRCFKSFIQRLNVAACDRAMEANLAFIGTPTLNQRGPQARLPSLFNPPPLRRQNAVTEAQQMGADVVIPSGNAEPTGGDDQEPGVVQVQPPTGNEAPAPVGNQAQGNAQVADQQAQAVSQVQSNDKICIICYDRPKNMLFMPCMHYKVCHECSLHFNPQIVDADDARCPICRTDINFVTMIYE